MSVLRITSDSRYCALCRARHKSHARRKFVDVAVDFPHECRHVIEELREIYRVDADTGRAGMSAEERLACHQRQSGPRMAALKTWLDGQLAERRVEPNSGAGEAIRYMFRHWERLTLFLRAPGAPLDSRVGDRRGGVQAALGCVRRFRLRARVGRAITPFPVPAASNRTGGFPASGSPRRRHHIGVMVPRGPTPAFAAS